jgi:uncharacterized protein YfaP (DUF2135 family)
MEIDLLWGDGRAVSLPSRALMIFEKGIKCESLIRGWRLAGGQDARTTNQLIYCKSLTATH